MLNKVLNVFSKNYRKETDYIIFLEENIEVFKLKDFNQNIEDNLNIETISDFHLDLSDIFL